MNLRLKERKDKLISFSHLPDEICTCFIQELIVAAFYTIIFISLGIHVPKLFIIIIFLTLFLLITELIRYYIIVSGKLLLIEGVCTSIEDNIDIPFISKFEKTKVCILQNESFCYKVTISKRKAKKIFAGMNIHIYVMPNNIYKNLEGFIVINNPMYMISKV